MSRIMQSQCPTDFVWIRSEDMVTTRATRGPGTGWSVSLRVDVPLSGGRRAQLILQDLIGVCLLSLHEFDAEEVIHMEQ